MARKTKQVIGRLYLSAPHPNLCGGERDWRLSSIATVADLNHHTYVMQPHQKSLNNGGQESPSLWMHTHAGRGAPQLHGDRGSCARDPSRPCQNGFSFVSFKIRYGNKYSVVLSSVSYSSKLSHLLRGLWGSLIYSHPVRATHSHPLRRPRPWYLVGAK